jgi:hypothetical protein
MAGASIVVAPTAFRKMGYYGKIIVSDTTLSSIRIRGLDKKEDCGGGNT